MKKILLSMMACAALCACTSDDALVDNPVNAEVTNGLYMKFNISMADATRSTTETTESDDYVVSSDGTEEGTDKENNVAKIVVVLTDEDGTVITTSTEYSGTSGTYYVVTFEAEDIEAYVSKDVNVFVYCNMPESFEMGTVDDIYGNGTDEDVATAWTDNMFFMSNAKLLTKTLPSDFTPYKDSSTPYDIGTVYVERSCARMDYKDGAIQTEGDVAFTYPMMVDEVTQEAQIDLVLSDIALINMSNQFYYLRHMAPSTDDNYDAADLSTDKVTILTPETNINWVIDTDASAKSTWTSESSSLSFTYPLEKPDEWEWTKLASFCIDTNTDNYKSKEYHPWRYLTENTIPSIAAQKNGITTGVVFKAQITPGEACSEELQEAFDGESTIYAFENQIVGTWEMVAAYAEAEGNYNTSLAYAYRQVMNLYGDGSETTLSEAQAEEGFTGYSPDSEGNYYCYYYYWNRHNDNGQPGVMGTMEFDVVRNNVYKLSVTGINYFGHAEPGTTDPDPDPVNPDDPDEDDNVYIQVSVQILPWVVRVNEITF